MLQRLIIAVTSEKLLLKEIREIIYSLYLRKRNY